HNKRIYRYYNSPPSQAMVLGAISDTYDPKAHIYGYYDPSQATVFDAISSNGQMDQWDGPIQVLYDAFYDLWVPDWEKAGVDIDAIPFGCRAQLFYYRLDQYGNQITEGPIAPYDVDTYGPEPGRPDLLFGSEYGDRISGLGGWDILFGNGGDDLIEGAEGGGELYGGDGDDALFGNVFIDSQVAIAGESLGGSGSILVGGRGDDILIGTDGDDEILLNRHFY